MKPRIRLIGVVMVPVFVGLAMGKRWPDADDNYYASTSQVIATLFIAITVEFFVREASEKTALEGLRVVLLIALSWLGFFACIRALAGDETGVTAGLAGAGVTAASILVSLALYERIKESSPASDRVDVIAAAVALLFLAIPVLLLILL